MKSIAAYLAVMLFCSLSFGQNNIDSQVLLNSMDQSVSIRVQAVDGSGCYGTGVLIAKSLPDSKNDSTIRVNLVLTCAHLFKKDIMVTTAFDIKMSSSISVYKHRVNNNGTKIGEDQWFADLIFINYSRDIAILRVNGCKDLISNTVFYSDKIIRLGTPIYHVSCFIPYSYSVMGCMISNPDFILESDKKNTFDKIDCVAVGGSSGGGVFTMDGQCIGLLSIAYKGARCSLIIPIRCIRECASKNNMGWVFEGQDLPDISDLDKYIKDIKLKLYE